MKIRILTPAPPLRAYVRCYWVLEGVASHHRERLFPNGETQAIFHWDEPFVELHRGRVTQQPRALLCGQFSDPKEVRCAQTAGLLGVVFRPAGMRALLRVSAHELAHDMVAFTDAIPAGQDLTNRIVEASSLASRVAAVERFLFSRLPSSSDPQSSLVAHAVELLRAAGPKYSISGLACELGVGERRLQRLFREHVGIGPKALADILRFTRALERLMAGLSLPEVAYTTGYCDQSHFVRDFRRFTGVAPSVYRKDLSQSSVV